MNMIAMNTEMSDYDESCASLDPYLNPEMIRFLSDRQIKAVDNNTVVKLFCTVDTGSSSVLDDHILAIA